MVQKKKKTQQQQQKKTCLGLFSFFYLKMKQEKKNTTKSRLKYLDVEKKNTAYCLTSNMRWFKAVCFPHAPTETNPSMSHKTLDVTSLLLDISLLAWSWVTSCIFSDCQISFCTHCIIHKTEPDLQSRKTRRASCELVCLVIKTQWRFLSVYIQE